jgi:murein DD-endopeptidase MepM/ murein hydrolase activator NlpD
VKRILCALIVLVLLAGCQPVQEAASILPSESAAKATNTATVTVQSATPTSVSGTPTKQAASTEAPASATPEKVETEQVELTICSPLLHETIVSISEIIGDPYKPPPPGREERHHGVDFSYYQHGERDTIEGEGVQAILPGTVVAVVENRLPYGNMVIVETSAAMLPKELVAFLEMGQGESLYHLYAHMQATPLVRAGEEVECGQALGTVGISGYNVINAHLHLETRLGQSGETFSGMAYYTTSASTEEMENYERWRTSGDFRHFDPMNLFAWFLGN